jgi:hypothetical protein
MDSKIPIHEKWLHEPKAAASLQTAMQWTLENRPQAADSQNILQKNKNWFVGDYVISTSGLSEYVEGSPTSYGGGYRDGLLSVLQALRGKVPKHALNLAFEEAVEGYVRLREASQAVEFGAAAQYAKLKITATDPDTKIWLAFSDGSLVECAKGVMEVSVLPGDYHVQFILNGSAYPIFLRSDTSANQIELEGGPTCDVPVFSVPNEPV